jgi:N-glycosylase/DNA lyase
MPESCSAEKKARIQEVIEIYAAIKDTIISRLEEFRRIWETGDDECIFAELVFCILTPQSKAKSCWTAVRNLSEKNLLLQGHAKRVAEELNIVRFRNRKAEYICEARRRFSNKGNLTVKSELCKLGNPFEARDWLVQNLKGLGYKEASHLLRNFGLGENLAILDRHILKNLKSLGVISKIPDSLSKAQYLDIEKKMLEFADRINIPVSHLDLALWYKETGEVFK